MKRISSGRCLCGALQFTVQGDPLWVAHCHCLSCRRNTGCAVATFIGYPVEKVEFTHGARAFYNSSPGVSRGFCKKCGTPISYEAERFPGEIHLYVSAMENPDEFVPQRHVYCTEKISWLELQDDLPRHQNGG